MKFIKTDNIYKITGLTKNDWTQILNFCFLGICFDDKDNTENTIQIIDLHFPEIDNTKVRTLHTELLKQVCAGLDSFNQSFETNYSVSKIYYIPFLNGSNSIYRTLISFLIQHYHEGKEFQEWYYDGTGFKEY